MDDDAGLSSSLHLSLFLLSLPNPMEPFNQSFGAPFHVRHPGRFHSHHSSRQEILEEAQAENC